MADYLGISRQAYGKYEAGQSEADHKTLVRLAGFFDVSVDFLLGHDIDSDENKRRKVWIDKIKTELPDADLMFNDLASMTAEDLEEVYEFVKFKLSKKER